MKNVEDVIAAWNDKPREAAKRLVEYYGDPDEICKNRLIWHNTRDGWKRTVLVNQAIPHNFPDSHFDFLEQVIDYQVPLDMYTPLAKYDGSIIVERTKGEISARCGGTSMNFVAINLAHEIIQGKRSVEDAREKYTELYQEYANGKESEYTKGFIFDIPKEDTKDEDVKTIS
ncbi:MAG: hypothetical protein PHS44_01605 [Candidatus Dojkabacteria bacterium]|nr:hypothetical protein [Candidatus Dojkabacteria bacterium]